MKFKFDENIPISIDLILKENGHDDIESVYSEDLKGIKDQELVKVCNNEDRVLITLDSDFANRILFPKGSYYAIILLKSKLQGKKAISKLLRQFIENFDLNRIQDNVVTFDGKNIRIQ